MTTRRKPSAALTKILSSIDENSLHRTRDRMTVAGKIADTLKIKGISQKKFAQMLGKSESEISEFLSGNRNFTLDTLSDISACLGMPFFPSSDTPTWPVQTEDARVKLPKSRKIVRYDMEYSQIIPQSLWDWQVFSASDYLTIAY